MENFTKLTDCLTIVAAEFGRVASTGLPSEGNNDYHFAFADDGLSNYVCAVDYTKGQIKVFIYLDFVILVGIDGTAKETQRSIKVTDQLYRLGGQLLAAGFQVEYK